MKSIGQIVGPWAASTLTIATGAALQHVPEAQRTAVYDRLNVPSYISAQLEDAIKKAAER